MSSFAAQTKKELTMLEGPDCCSRAELAALIRMNGSLQFGAGRLVLDVTTENAAIARRIYTLTKKIFNIHAELLVRKKMRLKKNNVYIVRIPNRANDILQELRIMDESLSFVRGISQDIVKKSCCRAAYLRGAFFGGRVGKPPGGIQLPSGDLYFVPGFLRGFDQNGQSLQAEREVH